MYLVLHQLFESSSLDKSGLDFILPRLVKNFQKDFSVFCDGGSGVGNTGWQYRRILHTNLEDAVRNEARIYCYEPLPENYQVMIRKFGNDTIYIPRNVAIANEIGTARFIVPSRMQGNLSDWSAGTSYGGFLNQTIASGDIIEVPTVRLEDEIAGCFDYIKLDLQGGELNAIKGLGKKLPNIKLLYVEAQLLSEDNSAAYLRQHGFITFFDQLQFGLNVTVQEIPFKELAEIGVVIDRVRVPDGNGIPLILWGHFSKYNGIIDNSTLGLKEEIKIALKKTGVSYMQTDLLSFNPTIFPFVSDSFSCIE